MVYSLQRTIQHYLSCELEDCARDITVLWEIRMHRPDSFTYFGLSVLRIFRLFMQTGKFLMHSLFRTFPVRTCNISNTVAFQGLAYLLKGAEIQYFSTVFDTRYYVRILLTLKTVALKVTTRSAVSKGQTTIVLCEQKSPIQNMLCNM